MKEITKQQIRVFAALNQQRQELINAFNEIAEAEKEQMEYLKTTYNLPKDKEYQLFQDGDKVYITERESTPMTEKEDVKEKK